MEKTQAKGRAAQSRGLIRAMEEGPTYIRALKSPATLPCPRDLELLLSSSAANTKQGKKARTRLLTAAVPGLSLSADARPGQMRPLTLPTEEALLSKNPRHLISEANGPGRRRVKTQQNSKDSLQTKHH